MQFTHVVVVGGGGVGYHNGTCFLMFGLLFQDQKVKCIYCGFQLTLAAPVCKSLGNLGTTFRSLLFGCYLSQSNCGL